jgi:hypothetical protein
MSLRNAHTLLNFILGDLEDNLTPKYSIRSIGRAFKQAHCRPVNEVCVESFALQVDPFLRRAV